MHTDSLRYDAYTYYGRQEAAKKIGPVLAAPFVIIGAVELGVVLSGIQSMGTIGRFGYRFAKHPAHHRFGRLGKLPHYQLNIWKYGVKGSGRTIYRIPLPK